jgi:hypothetical protein
MRRYREDGMKMWRTIGDNRQFSRYAVAVLIACEPVTAITIIIADTRAFALLCLDIQVPSPRVDAGQRKRSTQKHCEDTTSRSGLADS